VFKGNAIHSSVNSSQASASGQASASVNGTEKGESLIKEIRAFFLTRPRYSCLTSDILSYFKVKVKQGDAVAVFKKMLKGVAKFEKDEFGNGTWILKQEFR